MKNDIIDVLMYLFDNFVNEQVGVAHEISLTELEEAGFPAEEVNKAFHWLEHLHDETSPATLQIPRTHAMRIFSPEECEKLDVACRSFLLSLEQLQVIGPGLRELIVHCVLSLESDLDLNQFKRIIFLILLNQPEQETAVIWLEELLYEDTTKIIH